MTCLHYQYKRVLFESGLGDDAADRWPFSRVLPLLRDAESKVIRRVQRDGTDPARFLYPIAAGEREIDLGPGQGFDALCDNILRVLIYDSASPSRSTRLPYVGFDMLDKDSPGWRYASAGPTSWPNRYTLDPWTGNMLLDPAPGYAMSDAVSIEALRKPYVTAVMYASGTVSATHGSTSVQGHDTGWGDTRRDIAVGQMLGVVPEVSEDDACPVPVRYYRISAINSASQIATIHDAYAENNITSASYTISSPSVLSGRFEELAQLPVYWALAMVQKAEGERELAADNMALFQAGLEEAEEDAAAVFDAEQTFGFAHESHHGF